MEAKNSEFVYEKEEKEFEIVLSIIKTIRSMSVQYNLQNDVQGKHDFSSIQ